MLAFQLNAFLVVLFRKRSTKLTPGCGALCKKSITMMLRLIRARWPPVKGGVWNVHVGVNVPSASSAADWLSDTAALLKRHALTPAHRPFIVKFITSGFTPLSRGTYNWGVLGLKALLKRPRSVSLVVQGFKLTSFRSVDQYTNIWATTSPMLMARWLGASLRQQVFGCHAVIRSNEKT